jgi:uncharacterized protein (DUF934 family)
MQLVAKGRFIENLWRNYEPLEGQLLPEFSIVPAAWLFNHTRAHPALPSMLGVSIVADDLVIVPSELYTMLTLMVIIFTATGDGRGFSVAARLRDGGYRGELRARGPLIADQYLHLRACGFDSIEIPDDIAARHTAPDWFKAYRRFPLRYQESGGALGSILMRRHAVTGAKDS